VCTRALDTGADLVDRSHQQSTATLSQMSLRRRGGRSAERAVGKKRLVKGTYHHVTPALSRRPLTRRRQPPFRRTGGPARAALNRVVIMSARAVDANPHPWRVALPNAFAAGQRLVHRSAAPLPQTSSGRAPITATSASGSLIPFTPCCAYCRHGLRLRCPRSLLASHQIGVTRTTICHTPSAPVVRWSRLGRAVGVRGVAGMARFGAAARGN
jgi:hypothetical protein